MKRIFLLLILLTMIMVSGCGTKGPLYLPDKEHPQKKDQNERQ